MSRTVQRVEYSWTEFLDAAKAHGANGSARNRGLATGKASDTERRTGFFRATFEEALAMGYGNGWMPESPNVANLLQHVETDLGESIQNSFDWHYDVSGMEVDIARYLSNEPECMIQAMPLKVMRTGRVIRLYVPATYPGNADAEQIIARGVAIMALVEAFSMLQHPTEIWAGICNHGQVASMRTAYLINVQQATEALDMPRIMFALAHPAFARQLGWSVKETSPYASEMGFSSSGGYGQASREIVPEDYADMADENVIVLPSIDSDRFDWKNEKLVVAWIKGQLTRIQDGQV